MNKQSEKAKQIMQEWRNTVLDSIYASIEGDRLRREHFEKTGHYHAMGIRMFMPGFDIRKVYAECEKKYSKSDI